MKKTILYLILIFTIFLTIQIRATGAIYYVSNTGNDLNNGTSQTTSWQTLNKINSTTFYAGDQILFKRGDTFRGYIHIRNSGSAGSPITFDAYGTGNKPKILGAKDYSSSTLWTLSSGNIWVTTNAVTTATDVANLIFNNETSYGIKRTTLSGCVAQGNWYINPSDKKVYLYSSSNPGTYYSHIEIGGAYIDSNVQETIKVNGANYITIRNLDVRYSPNNGIIYMYGCQHGLVEYCDVSWIGGMYVPSEYPVRMGNGIGIWQGGTDIIIRYNRIDQCYDAGISPQGGDGYAEDNIQMYYNLITNCYYSFEWFTRSPNTFNNVNFYNNTCVNAGSQWSQGQRPSYGSAEHIRNTDSNTPSISNCHIQNNIFSTSVIRGPELGLTSTKVDCNYNLWYVNTMGDTDTGGPYTTLAQWRSATSHDPNSLSASPSFVSSTDFRLSSGSPAINAGINVGLLQDFNGVVISGLPDIGAYEYAGTVVAAPTVTTTAISNIGTISATGGGNITSDGGSTITARGICWSTSTNPTIVNSCTTDGTGTGTFTSNLSSLTSSTLYYVRSYATNSVGTAYGTQVLFTTLSTTPTVCDLILNGSFSSDVYWIKATGVTITGGECVINTTSNYTTLLSQDISILYNQTYRVQFDITNYISGTIRWVFGSTSVYTTPNGIDYKANGHYTYDIIVNNTSAPARITFYSYASGSVLHIDNVSVAPTTMAVPVVTTTAISTITSTSATGGGNITSDGGCSITSRGVCWSTTLNPTIANSFTNNGTGIGTYTSSLTGLTSATTYHVRSYATNTMGTSYGADIQFTTSTVLSAPIVTTTIISNISATSATSGGNVTFDGGTTVTARGICWSTSLNPTIANSRTTDGTGTGIYVSQITGLSGSTIYHIRAYATNSVSTSYGTDIQFTTLTTPVAPTVTTTAISNIGTTSASSGGNVTSDGGTTVTTRGVCWSTTINPTIANSRTTDGTGTGVFTSSLTGLTSSTTYHVRAYATNNVSTSYGPDVQFTTSTVLVTPTVITTSISNITTNSASSGGNITSDGGVAITARGVCWGTSIDPTISNLHTSDGTGAGIFISNLTGLNSSTHYYVRAYATNSVGTSYGTNVELTTNTIPVVVTPTVTTTTISGITATTASGGGNVISDGGGTIIARGICWSVLINPTITDAHTTDGIGTGIFTSGLTGLNSNTHYYVRAYATNSVGTSYGSNVDVTTLSSIILIYLNSTINIDMPTILEMSYNLGIANIVPNVSAFSVKVNSVTVVINSISISGNNVILTLENPIVGTDIVTVSYTVPSSNQLQTPEGYRAISIIDQSVIMIKYLKVIVY